MESTLANLRKYLPAEVTAAYVAIQGALTANGIERGEWMDFMLGIVGILLLCNAYIYWKFRRTKNLFTQAIVAIGFIIWALNTDMERFEDLNWIGEHIEVYAPTLLVLYSLGTSMMKSSDEG